MLRNVAPKAKGQAIRNARRLRAEMSLPEVILWLALRSRPNGLKFRRQHPSGSYILDFFCSDARLAIEIDGEAHSMDDRPGQDATRDGHLSSAGIETMRVPAVAVLEDINSALAHILATAASRLPLHHPAAPGGPPPRDKLGED